MSYRCLNALGFSFLVFFGFFQVARAIAAEREAFFKPNSARDVLPESVLISNTKGIEYWLPQPKEEEEPEQEELQKLNIQIEGKSEEQLDANVIMAKFGDPTVDTPVLALDSAPKPLQAIWAAMQIGDSELAYQYAKQHARYLRDFKDRNLKIAGIIGAAMVKEGTLPAKSWISSEQFDEQRRFLEADLKAENEREKEAFEKLESMEAKLLDPEAQALLDRAKREVGDEVNIEKIEPPADEDAARQELRQKLAGAVPLARDGKVDVYLFLRPADRGTRAALQEMQVFYEANKFDPNLSVIGLSTESVGTDVLAGIAWTSKSTFPMRIGSELAKKLGIKSVPSVVFVARESGEALHEQGLRPGYFMDEVLRAMRGGKK